MLIKSLEQSIKDEGRFGATFLTAFSGIIATLLLIGVLVARPEIRDFTFNWYAVMSGIGIAINFALIIFISKHKKSVETSMRYSLVLIGLVVLGVSETLLRLSANPEAALFWRELTIFSAVFTPIALLFFVFHYTGRHTLKHYVWTAISVFLCSLFIIYIGLTTDLIFVNQVDSMFYTFYGYEIDIGPLAILYFLWIVVILILSLIELIRYRRLMPSGPKHKQAQMFIYAIIFLICSTIIIEAILPAMDIVFVQLGSITGAIAALLIAYGMSLRVFFTVNPATIVNTILDTMADAVIVTDTDFTTIYSNKFAGVHLQLPEHKMIGRNVSNFLEKETFEKIKAALANYESGKEIAIIDQGEMNTDNYEQRYVDISVSKVMENAQLVGYIFSFSNSSEPKFRADFNKRQHS